jgi:hypothetical protein
VAVDEELGAGSVATARVSAIDAFWNVTVVEGRVVVCGVTW